MFSSSEAGGDEMQLECCKVLSSCGKRWFPINQLVQADGLVGPLVSVSSFSGFQQQSKESCWCFGGTVALRAGEGSGAAGQ